MKKHRIHKKKMAQMTVGFLLCMSLCTSLVGPNIKLVKADPTEVEINEENFPCEAFKDYVKDNFDTDENGTLNQAEIAAIESIEIYNRADITSLKGISYFTNLKTLYCPNCKLENLDLSNNIALQQLDCSINQLTTLNISNNTALKDLLCNDNNLTSLNVSNNTALQTLDCFSNNLTTLNVSNNSALQTLYCYYNNLTTLNVSNNSALQTLYCFSNNLTTLNVSNNSALQTLDCSYNQLSSMDLSNNNSLTTFFCSNNRAPVSGNSIDISTLPGFDASKVSNCSGGNLSGTIFTFDESSDTISYDYDCGQNKTATFILAKRASQAITTDKDNYTLTYGAAPFNLGAKATTDLSYSSSNRNVASVDEKGNVTITGGGTATITINATQTDEYDAATKDVTIVVNSVGQTVTSNKDSYTLTYGAAPFNLGAKATTDLTYSSSNRNVATVDASGKVSIKGAGTATITINAQKTASHNGATKTVKITVNKASQKIKAKISKKTYRVSALKKKKKTFKIGASANGKLSYKVTKGKKYISVSKSGKVTIKKKARKGTYKIKVSAKATNNYKAATKTITIKIKK